MYYKGLVVINTYTYIQWGQNYTWFAMCTSLQYLIVLIIDYIEHMNYVIVSIE
jgi:hypothetical protein